jgi:CheY-like chemotaxis protein/two-component sensor histidine kinase
MKLDIQSIGLAEVVQAAVDTVRPAANAKSVRLSVTLHAGDWQVMGDANRLQQVFWNLISNAVKFTPKGGQVQVLLQRAASQLEVSVIDTGEGIAADFLPFVFDRFRQADATTTRRYGGLGLGLSIVKQLVELHGGSVQVASAGPGRGATFTVHLPAPTGASNVTTDATSEQHAALSNASGLLPQEACERLSEVRVLAVDDESDARGLLRRLLEDCGAKVVLAESAADAFEKFVADPPDVLISDVGMPGEDGYTLMRRIRELTREFGGNTPSLALTAYARPEDRVRAVRAGFNMHLVKPVDPAELITMIASVVARAK